MKLKIKKIDKAQAVELLTAHVEKFVFGVFILGFVLFFIGALKQSPYPKRPDQLDADAKRVSNKVDTSTFDPATDVPEVKELPKVQDVAAAAWNTQRVVESADLGQQEAPSRTQVSGPARRARGDRVRRNTDTGGRRRCCGGRAGAWRTGGTASRAARGRRDGGH